MFVGNSITLHSPKPEIGWTGEWGMAASSRENDYVHLCIAEILKTEPDAAFCVCQAADWECRYKNGGQTYPLFQKARDFAADVIIMRIVENCPHRDDFDAELFSENYAAFIDFLDPKGAKKVITGSFWKHPADPLIERYAASHGHPYVGLSDLGERDDMKAIGLFEHRGVAAHPGDLGMKTIAERIMEKIRCV